MRASIEADARVDPNSQKEGSHDGRRSLRRFRLRVAARPGRRRRSRLPRRRARETSATRQRPGWTLVGWWLPASVTAPTSPSALPKFGRLVLVGLIILALVIAAIVAVGSREQRLPPPFGLARNGIVITAIGGQLYTVDQHTGATTALAPKPSEGSDFGPMFSRDGTKLLYARGLLDGRVELVAANTDGTGARS